MEQKLQWVKEAAGSRIDELELAIIIFGLQVTDYPRAAAEPWAKQFGLSVDEVLQSPNFLFGNEDELVYTIEERRRRFGLTYLTLRVEAMRSFGPIMRRLRTTIES